MIKVLLVDDHEMVRMGVSAYLSTQPDIEVVGEAENGRKGSELALQLRPDIILMDLVMDKMDGIASSKAILQDNPEMKILILTSFLDDEKIFPALEAGVKGYILKTSQAHEIAESVRKIAMGQDVISESVRVKIYEKQHAKPTLHDSLTAREVEVLKEIAKGLSNQEIGDTLFISLKTVKTHVSNILAKLQVEDRTQAAIYAIKCIPERVTWDDRATVETARALYDKVATTLQKGLVSNYGDLVSAEQRIKLLDPANQEKEEDKDKEKDKEKVKVK